MVLPTTWCCANPVTADHLLADGAPASAPPEMVVRATEEQRIYLRPAAVTIGELKLAPDGSLVPGTAPCADIAALFEAGLKGATTTTATGPGILDDYFMGWWLFSPLTPLMEGPSSIMELQASAFDVRIIGGTPLTSGNATVTVRHFSP
jgi:hypothetical protein